MKNITVSVPDDVYRAARIRAAEEGRSVSGLVAEYLRSLTGADEEFLRLEAQQHRIQAQIDRFRASDRLTRDEVRATSLTSRKIRLTSRPTLHGEHKSGESSYQGDTTRPAHQTRTKTLNWVSSHPTATCSTRSQKWTLQSQF